MSEVLRNHWPEYVIEGACLGLFMISAFTFATILEHPASPLHRALPHPLLRRFLMGLAMGGTAIAIIYSRWGKRSGAHINPSTTLTFFRLGKIDKWDALFYVAAQFLGGSVGAISAAVLVAIYITVEAPLSGMSMNPARTFASAVPAHHWAYLWIYFVGPVLGMICAAEVYLRTRGATHVLCAKLHHENAQCCIFCGKPAGV